MCDDAFWADVQEALETSVYPLLKDAQTSAACDAIADALNT